MSKILFKVLFVSIFLFQLSNDLYSQSFLLLDRKWSKAAVLADSVTKDDLSKGFFPIYKQDLDTLIVLISKFRNLKEDGLTRKFYYTEDFKTEHFEFEIENIKRTFGDGYEINLISNGPFGRPTLKLSDPRNNLPANEAVVRSFLRYLEKTKERLATEEVPGGKKSRKK